MTSFFHTYSDGGARGNPGPAACGALLCDETGKILQEASESIGETTNNQAEYRGMLLALELARKRKAKRLVCHSDSELMIFQLQGIYRIKDSHLKELAADVRRRVSRFEAVHFRQVPRSHPLITRADKLLNRTLNRAKLKSAGASSKRSAEPLQRELF